MFTSEKLLDFLCPHLSPAWYQGLSSLSAPTATFCSLLGPAGRPELGLTILRGKVVGMGTPVNL